MANSEFDDKAGVNIIDHLVIRDSETKEVLVNQRGSAKNQDLGDDDDE